MKFELKHAATLHDYDFKQGNLVLMCNTAIKKSLSRKMHSRYLGPPSLRLNLDTQTPPHRT